MNPQDYIHERDIYYVVNAMHMSSLALKPPYKFHAYNLKDHHTILAPLYSDQRIMLQFLNENKIVSVKHPLNKRGKPTQFSKGWSYKFRRINSSNAVEPLRQYHTDLLLKLDEAHLNQEMLNKTGKLLLETDGEYIYVVFPHQKLRVNTQPLRQKSDVQLLFEYLIDQAKGELVTKESYQYTGMSRGFEDMIVKKGFKGMVRKKFLPVLDKKKVQLLTEVEMNIKDSTAIYKQLIKDPYNKKLYEDFMKKTKNLNYI